jgi:hypothetical protein
MKHPSGAKARVDFAGFMYGLKPVPFKTSTYSEDPKSIIAVPVGMNSRFPTLFRKMRGKGWGTELPHNLQKMLKAAPGGNKAQ